jgi:DNA-binding XRE family transcriptional regulator
VNVTEEMSNFRFNVAFWRVMRGYSQLELSHVAGLNVNAAHRAEKTSRVPDLMTCIALAKALDVTMNQLLADPPADWLRQVEEAYDLFRVWSTMFDQPRPKR